MSVESNFRDAFDSLASVGELAAKAVERVPEIPRAPVEAIAASDRDEIVLVVEDGVARSVRVDEGWLTDAPTDEVEQTILTVFNEAWRQWGRASLAEIQNVTPEMTEVTAAISAARAQLHEAFHHSLRHAREM